MNKSWIHRANKLREVNTDFEKVSKIQDYLNKHGYHSLQGMTLITHENKIRHPDLLMKIGEFTIPIELDGSIHGYGDEVSESEQTKQRNDDYKSFYTIIINEAMCEERGISYQEYALRKVKQLEKKLLNKKEGVI
jgi:hypothetical protein